MIAILVIVAYIAIGALCATKYKAYLKESDYADKILAVSLWGIFLLCIALDKRELRKRMSKKDVL